MNSVFKFWESHHLAVTLLRRLRHQYIEINHLREMEISNDEKKALRFIDWGVYALLVPAIIVLTPYDRLIEHDRYFVALMMIYIVVIHTLNKKFNFVTYLFNNHYKKATCSLLLVVATTWLTAYFANTIKISDFSYQCELPVSEIRIRVLLTLCFIDISFATMLGLIVEIFRQKIAKKDIETEKDKAELALYKSQINPHFMFNTLNSIYALNFTNSSKTGEVIMKFSNIVKYIYQNSDKEKIMISEEVKYLTEFIDIHTLRLNEQTKVNFISEVDDNSEYIPSMIFITFVENIFKHGVSSTEDSTIDIFIKLENKRLTFTTSNTNFSKKKDSSPSGIGIKNCRKRLSLLYPNRYTLLCTDEGLKYKTTLTIEL